MFRRWRLPPGQRKSGHQPPQKRDVVSVASGPGQQRCNQSCDGYEHKARRGDRDVTSATGLETVPARRNRLFGAYRQGGASGIQVPPRSAVYIGQVARGEPKPLEEYVLPMGSRVTGMLLAGILPVRILPALRQW